MPTTAFATPNSSSGISWDSGSQSILQRLVSSAKSSGQDTKIVLSIGRRTRTFSITTAFDTDLGGWGGSYWFSQAMSTAANRSTFVNAAVNAVNTYGLDGKPASQSYATHRSPF